MNSSLLRNTDVLNTDNRGHLPGSCVCFITWFRSRLTLLGGSWEVISGVIIKVTMVITPIRGLITPLITTHEPPSTLFLLVVYACKVKPSVPTTFARSLLLFFVVFLWLASPMRHLSTLQIPCSRSPAGLNSLAATVTQSDTTFSIWPTSSALVRCQSMQEHAAHMLSTLSD